jgi:hypothetical protein
MDASPNDRGGQSPAQKFRDMNGIIKMTGHQRDADQIGRFALLGDLLQNGVGIWI